MFCSDRNRKLRCFFLIFNAFNRARWLMMVQKRLDMRQWKSSCNHEGWWCATKLILKTIEHYRQAAILIYSISNSNTKIKGSSTFYPWELVNIEHFFLSVIKIIVGLFRVEHRNRRNPTLPTIASAWKSQVHLCVVGYCSGNDVNPTVVRKPKISVKKENLNLRSLRYTG